MKLQKKISFYLVVLLLVALGSVPLQAGGGSQNNRKKIEPVRAAKANPVKPAPAGPATDPAKADPVAPINATYEIGSGDILGVNVWREPEISQKLTVRPDGMISLPLVGDIPASGQTPQNLAQVVSDKLKTYLTNPLVTVIVVEVHSKWFVVMGEVSKPGRYPLAHPMTVMEALSLAGGFHEFAKTSKIYVLHNENGKTVRIPFNYNRVVKGQGQSANIEVHHGDTIVVP